MKVTKRIRVRCYTMKEARFIMLFLVKNGFEGVTNDSYRDCDLFARVAFDTDGICFVGIALSRGASMRVSNLHDSVSRKDYIEVSKSKFISEVTKFKQFLRKPWKEGDILAFNGSDGVYCSGIYAVFDKYAEKNTFESHILINSEGMRFGVSLPTADYHLATYLEEVDFNRLYSYMMPHLKAAGLCLPKKI